MVQMIPGRITEQAALILITRLDDATDIGPQLPADDLLDASRKLLRYSYADEALANQRLAYTKARESFRRAHGLPLQDVRQPWSDFLVELGWPSLDEDDRFE
ncbi:MAG: hypothetical protein QOE72_1020, partial [Chloroflexota bacterium]|nr:hypothetical protein [Chloroflexota bacterium]